MDIGEPQRRIVVEPIEDPVPAEAPSEEPSRDVPEREPATPTP